VDVEARPRRWTDGARDPEKAVVTAVTYAEVSREIVRSRIDGVARRRADRRGRDETAGPRPPTPLIDDGLLRGTSTKARGWRAMTVLERGAQLAGGTRADRWCRPGGW
jgi:hypothetical protein